MNRSDLANVIMTGRRAARRSNCRFLLRPDAPRIAGLSQAEFGRVMATVQAIESFTDAALAALETGSGLYICTNNNSATSEPSKVMEAAYRAQAEVDKWSESKRRYADRTVGGEPDHIIAPLQQVLDFLNSIEGAGYGGMASFEIARMTVSEEVEALTSYSVTSKEAK